MRTRSMAALLLLTMVSWVGSFAQSSGTPDRETGVTQITSPSADHTHDCCGLRTLLTKPALPVQPAGMPCGEEHPCCVRPGPQATPNLPTVFEHQKLDVVGAAIPALPEKAHLAFEQDKRVSPRLLEFSTVLRI